MSCTRVGRLIFVVGLALGLLAMGSWAQGQPPCTVTVKLGESIQKAIDQAAEGAIICLTAGRWEENLVITKGLVLQGRGKEPDEVQIAGAEEGHPVMRIEGKREIEVVIENLMAAAAEGRRCAMYEPQLICPDGLQVLGKAKVIIRNARISGNRGGLWVEGLAQVSLTNSTVSYNGWAGLAVSDSARVSLSHSTVSNNEWAGLFVTDSATVSITNSTVSSNEFAGLFIINLARVSLTNSTASDNAIGFFVVDSATVNLSHSTVSDNVIGLLVADLTTVSVTNSIVSDNRSSGFSVSGSATVKVKESKISGNKGHGIFLWEKVVAEIWENRIFNNWGYGVALFREGCVVSYDSRHEFVGQVTGKDNTIPGRVKPEGNKQGDVCPADYPWPPGFRK